MKEVVIFLLKAIKFNLAKMQTIFIGGYIYIYIYIFL